MKIVRTGAVSITTKTRDIYYTSVSNFFSQNGVNRERVLGTICLNNGGNYGFVIATQMDSNPDHSKSDHLLIRSTLSIEYEFISVAIMYY